MTLPLNLALTAVFLSVVFALQAHRDSGVSLLPGRLGRGQTAMDDAQVCVVPFQLFAETAVPRPRAVRIAAELRSSAFVTDGFFNQRTAWVATTDRIPR